MHTLLALPAWLVLVLVALLPALEASTLLGLVVPGETTVLAGGVAAHFGVLPLWSVVVAAVCGAVVGDQVGYALGRRYGPRLLSRVPARAAGAQERALSLVRRRGAVAVVVGRWAAALRALVPGVAGMTGIGRRRFTVANLAGGTVWATTVAVGGYLAGASYTALEHRLRLGGAAVLAAAVVSLALRWLYARLRSRRGAGVRLPAFVDADDRCGRRPGRDQTVTGHRFSSAAHVRIGKVLARRNTRYSKGKP